MADQFVAEIRIFGFNFAPTGWATCDGQLMPISQNTALFSLLGTTYGGDGRSTFALPNLQGSTPLQPGQGPGLSLRDLGETGGEPTVTVLQSEMPQHGHSAGCYDGAGNQTDPSAHALASAHSGRQPLNAYAIGPANTTMNPTALSPAGGSLPHNNLMPYQTLNFCIALQGIFPPRG